MKKYLSSDIIKHLLDGIKQKEGKKLIFVDMDGVIADFDKQAEIWAAKLGITGEEFKERKLYRQKGFYLSLDIMPGAKEAIDELKKHFEIRFLSACSWSNVDSFTEKRIWIEKHFGEWSEKRMDLTNRKDLTMGHFLVDDRTKYGAEDFIGEHIMFGNEKFPDWEVTKKYLISKK